MNKLLTIVAFALLFGFLYVLGSTVPRPDLLGVIGVTLVLAFWDLFFHDRMRLRRARKDDPTPLSPELAEPGTVRDDGRPVEGIEGDRER